MNFHPIGFLSEQVNTKSKSVRNIKLNLGMLFLFPTFCGTWEIELGKIRDEGTKTIERALVAYRNGRRNFHNIMLALC